MERAAFLFNFAPESLLGKFASKAQFSTPSLATSRLANIGSKGALIQGSEYVEEIAQAAAPSITAAMADSFGWTLNEKTNFEAESKNWKLHEFTVADLDGNLFRVFYDFSWETRGELVREPGSK